MKDFWAEELQNRKKSKIVKLIILIIICLIFISFIASIFVYYYNIEFRQWCDENILRKSIEQKNTKYIDLDGDDNTQVCAYEKYICVFRKKNLEFYNKIGTQVAKIELDINEAVFKTDGRYMAVCEKEGSKFYLICGNEKVYESEVDGDISQINVNKSGYVSVVISNNSYKSIVYVFDKTGEEVFKTNLVSARVADVEISQDSKYLAIAEIDLSGILIQSSIQVVSMDLAKINTEQAMFYKYEAPTDKLIMNIEYQDQNKLICMYSDGIELLENQKSTSLINFEDEPLEFVTIALSNKIAIVDEVTKGEYTADTKVKIMDSTTKKEREYNTESIAKSIQQSDNKIVLNLGTELHIINKSGILLKRYISESEIKDIVMTDAVVGIVYKDKIQILNI